MMLINAVMFDAQWQDKYEKDDIVSGTFENYDGTEVSVSYLHSTESIYFENESASGFAKEYDGGAYSFVGLIPNEEVDVYDFAESLNGETWLELWDSRQTDYGVTAIMPEFTYEADTGLNDILEAMGMTDAFSGVNADFSGISDEQTYLSKVEQKAYIQVDRNGTKAAAVTWGKLSKEAMPNFVRLDRPFVWAIVDNNTGLPLFIGIVTKL